MEEVGADGKQPQSTGDRIGLPQPPVLHLPGQLNFFTSGDQFWVSDYFIYFYFFFAKLQAFKKYMCQGVDIGNL